MRVDGGHDARGESKRGGQVAHGARVRDDVEHVARSTHGRDEAGQGASKQAKRVKGLCEAHRLLHAAHPNEFRGLAGTPGSSTHVSYG
ncbi:hypothetical protein GCM10007967_26730 [Xylanimonas ulmi]